jgi:hypothetical protein
VSAESGYIDCSDECIAAIRSAADWSVSDDLVLETKSLDIKPIPIKWREFVSQAGTEFNFREFSVQGVRIQARPNVRVAAGGSAGDKKVSVSFPKLASVAMLYTARQDPHETLSEKLTAAAETFVIGTVTVRWWKWTFVAWFVVGQEKGKIRTLKALDRSPIYGVFGKWPIFAGVAPMFQKR